MQLLLDAVELRVLVAGRLVEVADVPDLERRHELRPVTLRGQVDAPLPVRDALAVHRLAHALGESALGEAQFFPAFSDAASYTLGHL